MKFYNLNLTNTYSEENNVHTILFGLVEVLNPSLIIWQQKKYDCSQQKWEKKIYRPSLDSICSNSQNKYIKWREKKAVQKKRKGEGL